VLEDLIRIAQLELSRLAERSPSSEDESPPEPSSTPSPVPTMPRPSEHPRDEAMEEASLPDTDAPATRSSLLEISLGTAPPPVARALPEDA
jgi:hypothetical protein